MAGNYCQHAMYRVQVHYSLYQLDCTVHMYSEQEEVFVKNVLQCTSTVHYNIYQLDCTAHMYSEQEVFIKNVLQCTSTVFTYKYKWGFSLIWI